MRTRTALVTLLLLSASLLLAPWSVHPSAASEGWTAQVVPGGDAVGSRVDFDVAPDGSALVVDLKGNTWYGDAAGRVSGRVPVVAPAGCGGNAAGSLMTRTGPVAASTCGVGTAAVTFASSDQGRTWAPRGVLPTSADSSAYSRGASGRLWASWMNLADAGTIAVSHSDDDGATWTAPSVVNRNPGDLTTGCSADDPSLRGCALAGNAPVLSLSLFPTPVAADPRHPDSVWLAWVATDGRDWVAAQNADEFRHTTKLYVAHSTDAGATWAMQQLIDLGTSGEPTGTGRPTEDVGLLGRGLAVDGHGNPALVYLERHGSLARRTMLARSRDGGRHWTTGAVVDPAASTASPALVASDDGALDVLLYASASPDPSAKGAAWDVVHTHMPADGTRWQREVLDRAVSHAPMEEQADGLAVDGSGRLHAMWLHVGDETCGTTGMDPCRQLVVARASRAGRT